MRDVDVHFGTGREVLGAYWGYLSDGGLVIADEHGLHVGELVALRVTIATARSCYRLSGKVVKTHSEGSRAVIAFEPGEPHDMLLTEALSDAEDVPARRHRRYRVELDAEVANGAGASRAARILNVSESGCCFRLPGDHRHEFAAGSKVSLRAGDLAADGEVVWAQGTERGVCYTAAPSEDVLTWVRTYLDQLRGA